MVIGPFLLPCKAESGATIQIRRLDIIPATRVPTDSSPLDMCIFQNTIQATFILRLPKENEVNPHLPVGVDINDRCFHHPLVIFSTSLVERKATMLMISIEAQNLLTNFE